MSRHVTAAFFAACVFLVLCAPAARLAAEDEDTVPKNAEIAVVRNPGTPVTGAANADVTVVEYLDYNCSYCNKDWPILSDASKYAAELALAARWQGKYPAAHDALMGASHLASHVQIEALLRAAGIDMATLQNDRAAHAGEIQALLQRNDAEADALGIRGTPGLLVGRHLISGVYDVAGLQQAVASARRDR